MPNLTEASRQEYAAIESGATHDQVKLGCLQRIATAAELMAKNHGQLISEIDSLRQSRGNWIRDYNQMCNKNKALRGVITKLKNKQQPSQNL